MSTPLPSIVYLDLIRQWSCYLDRDPLRSRAITLGEYTVSNPQLSSFFQIETSLNEIAFGQMCPDVTGLNVF